MCAISPISTTRSSTAAREAGEPIEALTRPHDRAVPRGHGRARPRYLRDVEPRCTEHVPQMIAMIERLTSTGHAYAAEGHVLFRGRPSWPDYGKLSRPQPAGDDRRRPRRGRAVQAAIPAISCCGNRPRPTSPAGTARGAAAVPAGTSNAPPTSEAHLGETFDIHGGGLDLDLPAPRKRAGAERGRARRQAVRALRGA